MARPISKQGQPSVPSQRARDADAEFRNWVRDQIRAGAHGGSSDHAGIMAHLLFQVAEAINEKLPTLREGQALGIVFRLEVINEDYTFSGERGDRSSDAAKRWRRAVYERDRFRCADCGATGDIHAHHIQPWAVHPEIRFEVSNGKTLCADCHATYHPDIPMLKYARRRNR